MAGQRWTPATAPRQGRQHRRYCFTIKDISAVTGRSEKTIRSDRKTGKINMGDIASIARYIMKYPLEVEG